MSRRRANGEGSIFPYRNGYAAYVWVDTPTGRRQRKYVYGKTREIVHAKYVELHRKARTGPVATAVPALGQYLNYWLDAVIKPNRAPLTYATYETLSRLYLIPGLGKRRLDRLQVKDIQSWLNKVGSTCQCCATGKDKRRQEVAAAQLASRAGKATRRNARKVEGARCCAMPKPVCCEDYLSPRTIRDLRAVLRSALSQAVLDELIPRNVAALVKLPAARSKKRKAWSSDEARAFLESARADGDPMYAAYVLVLVLGLRKGEVLGLEWSGVDLDKGELVVGKQIQRVRRQLLHRETKTEASEATLPLPEICIAALRQRAAEQAAMRETAMGWTESDLVFTRVDGMPVEPRTFNRAFTARCEKAGVRVITVHDARRTCATILADLDVHPRVAMQILRHAQFAVTMEIYTQVSSEKTREALKRLGESLGG